VCCFCLGERGEVAKSKRSKCTFGILLLLTAMLTLCMCAVGIWADVELNSRIMERSADINDFLDSVLTNKSASDNNSTINAFVAADQVRHWVLVGYLILLMTLLVVVIAVVVFTPLCQSTAVVIIKNIEYPSENSNFMIWHSQSYS
jgi:hypothetical protein